MQNLSTVIVPVSPEKKRVKFRSNSIDKPYTGLSTHDYCFVSRHCLPCHAPYVSHVVWEDSGCVASYCFHLVPSVFFLSSFKAVTTSVLFSLGIWFYDQTKAWNEICACACHCLCAILYHHSRNASTPPSSSRRTRHTTAAVVPLPSVSQGAVKSVKDNEMRGQKKTNPKKTVIWHGCSKMPQKVHCNKSVQPLNWLEEQELTGGFLKYPDCLWIITPRGRYEELHLSRLFSSSSSSGGSDLLIALRKILYHWNTTSDTIHRTKYNQWGMGQIDTSHSIKESDFWISMTQHRELTLNKMLMMIKWCLATFSSNQLSYTMISEAQYLIW